MALLASASVGSAADCTSDPNECTLKKLCEASTTLDGSGTIWATASETAKHVALAQSLGMKCGVTPIVDLCETDPSECKVSEICGKATTGNGGQISWDDSAAGHVALAKEYGLSCDVVVEAAVEERQSTSVCNLSNQTACNDPKVLCSFASFAGKWETRTLFIEYVKEAKKRGLSCGVKQQVAIKQGNCTDNMQQCTSDELCNLASYTLTGTKRYWRGGRFSKYTKEAQRLGLSCGVNVLKHQNNGDEFKTAYKSLPALRRKQLQYALKKLGLYSKSIDGIWGSGTMLSFTNYIKINDLKPNNSNELFSHILSKVSVPNSFASNSARGVNRNTNNNAANRAAQQRQSDMLINLGTSLMNSSRGTSSPSRSIDCYTYGNNTTCY